MATPPPDEQLRRLLAGHDALLAETARQNRNLHDWAIRYGPRPIAPIAPIAPVAPVPGSAPFSSAAHPVGAAPLPAAPQAPGWWAAPAVAGSQPLPPSPPPVQVAAEPAEARRPPLTTTQLVSRLVAGAGAVVTLVGIAFILVLAAQNGYFGPIPRTISAALLGAALTAAAFLLRRRDPDNAGAPALLATGMAAGFLAVVAGTTLYNLMPALVGLVLASALGLGVTGVAAWWRSQWLACLAIAAALIIGPWVSGDIHVGAAFMVALSAVAAVIHLRVRWPVFHLARTIPTSVLLVALAATGNLSTRDLGFLTALAAVYAMVGLASTILGRKTSEGEQTALACVLLVTALPVMELTVADLHNLAVGWVVPAAAAVLYAAAAMLRGTSGLLKGLGLTLAGILALEAFGIGTDLSVEQLLLPGLATVYMAAAAGLRDRVVGVIACLASAIAILPWLFTVGLPNGLGLSFGDYLIGSVLIVLLALSTQTAAHEILGDATPRWLRYVLIVLGLVGFGAAVTSAGYLIGRAVDSPIAIQQGSSVVVTVCWALASVLALQRPLRSADRSAGWVRLGLALALVALGKLFLVDLAVLPGLARGLAFLLVGLLLLLLGITYAKAYERVRGATSVPPSGPAPQGSPAAMTAPQGPQGPPAAPYGPPSAPYPPPQVGPQAPQVGPPQVGPPQGPPGGLAVVPPDPPQVPPTS